MKNQRMTPYKEPQRSEILTESLNEDGSSIANSFLKKFKAAKKIGYAIGYNIPDLHTMLLFLEEIEKEKKVLGIETPIELMITKETGKK